VVSTLPTILEPDKNLSFCQLNFLGEFDAFFARQERLSDESAFHRVQLSACEHRPAAAPAARTPAVGMATRTWHKTQCGRFVVRRTTACALTMLHGRAGCHFHTRLKNFFRLQQHNNTLHYTSE